MKNYNFSPAAYSATILPILQEVATSESIVQKKLEQILKKYPKDGNSLFARDELVQGYYYLVKTGQLHENKEILAKIKLKPTRTISGVVPVTVLTKPFPCPGKCIFCPNDIRMPKSYLSDEPGAQRAERNSFDPYLQVYNRLLALRNTGHEVAKIELIVLGGTWSFYPESYQIWFIKRCFDALNEFGTKDRRAEVNAENIFYREEKSQPMFTKSGRRRSYNELVTAIRHKSRDVVKVAEAQESTCSWEDLSKAQKINETAGSRAVGLVIETRPDHISAEEIVRIRRLGATKTQIGFQSLQDNVLSMNKRGHDVAATERAVALLRSAGFKIHAHWMPNLYGSDVDKDKKDYLKIYTTKFQPDELKIYPCSLIATAELSEYYNKGLWSPYTEAELLDVVSFALANTPRYTRLTRVIRDIPSTDIVVGNKKTNFREIAERKVRADGFKLKDIRAREVRSAHVNPADLRLKVTEYDAKGYYGPGKELFLEYITSVDKICGFLRLSLPVKVENHYIPELNSSAIIREVHVYGVAQNFGGTREDSAQHLGLGKKLIARAKELARKAGYGNLAVISSIGTKEYYRGIGFKDGDLYQHLSL